MSRPAARAASDVLQSRWKAAATFLGAFGQGRLRCFAFAALATCALALLQASPFVGWLDGSLGAVRARMLERPPSDQIVVVEIDHKSLEAMSDWPWPRSRFAQVIEVLRESGATLIGFDIDFSLSSNKADDLSLKKAIEATPGAIVLPTFVQRDGSGRNLPLAALTSEALIASVNVPLDSDGTVRRYNYGAVVNGAYQPSMGATLAAKGFGREGSFALDYSIDMRQAPRVSIADVLNGRADPALFRNKVVLIGATASEFGDFFKSPIAIAEPGVYIHALAFESLSQGRALVQANRWVIFAVALMVMLALWPRGGAIGIGRILVTHAAIGSAVILLPILTQTLAPVSLDLGLVLVGQVFSIWAAVNWELQRRARAVVEQREAHLLHAATHDSETNLPNRIALIQAIERAQLVAQESGQSVVVIALGIERFSTLRAAIGQKAALELKRKLHCKMHEVRGDVTAYQISAVASGLVLLASSEAEAEADVRALLDAVGPRIDVFGRELDIFLRFGIACQPDKTAEELIEFADLALDSAQKEKYSAVHFEPRMWSEAQERLVLISDIQQGLERGEFSLVYQPKLSLRDGSIKGVEALLRWRHATLGAISPADFVPIAEDTGAVEGLTRFAVSRAIAELNDLKEAGFEGSMSVNISGSMLSEPRLCDFILAEARKATLPLCLEITETAVISDPLAAMFSIEEFRGAGIAISIDDYGTGLSSLSYLKQINADELKLDKSLIDSLSHNARDRLILKSTIDLAHALGMSVVAEGIEDEGVATVLAGLGCDVIQGYWVSRPVPMPALIGWMRARSAETALPSAGAAA